MLRPTWRPDKLTVAILWSSKKKATTAFRINGARYGRPPLQGAHVTITPPMAIHDNANHAIQPQKHNGGYKHFGHRETYAQQKMRCCREPRHELRQDPQRVLAQRQRIQVLR